MDPRSSDGGGGGGSDRKSSKRRSERKGGDERKRKRERKGRDRERGRDRDRKRRRHRRDDGRSLSSSSSSSSSASSGDRKERRRTDHDRKRRRDRKRKKKHKKEARSGRRRDRSRSPSGSPERRPAPAAADPLRSSGLELAGALAALLSTHPKMATELPYLLIRMAGGTTFDLSAMPDPAAALGLEKVFAALGRYGVKRDARSGSWTWDDGGGPGGRRPGAELVLIKLARSLLDSVGVTAEACRGYDGRMRREEEEAKQKAVEVAEAEAKRRDQDQRRATELAAAVQAKDRRDHHEATSGARVAVLSLLAKFKGGDGEGDADASTLPAELGGIANIILEGESVVLDDIPDEKLRSGLEELFVALGLVRVEIEVEDESDSEGKGRQKGEKSGAAIMGYALSDDSSTADASISRNLLAVVEECRTIEEAKVKRSTDAAAAPARKPVQGPAMGPPPGFSAAKAMEEFVAAPPSDDSDAEDEGPAPLGSEMARKRQHIGQKISSDALQAMADRRRMQLADVAAGGTGEIAPTDAGGREEWMLTPGKHDFLKGIKSANPFKGRKFKNEKARGGGAMGGAEEAGPALTPQMQAEMDSIRKAVEDARGPTLIDQHRQTKAEEKASNLKSGKAGEFNWTREDDLDAGRRVDKNALHMILGGASDALKDKFQGSFSKGFM